MELGVWGYAIILLLAVVIAAVFAYTLGTRHGISEEGRRWEEREPDIREDARKRSRATTAGLFSEQLAPYLPDFPFSPTEARFIGAPIDFIVFQGLHEERIEQAVFVEVKSGGSRLSKSQRLIRDAIHDGRVDWFEYRVPRSLSN